MPTIQEVPERELGEKLRVRTILAITVIAWEPLDSAIPICYKKWTAHPLASLIQGVRLKGDLLRSREGCLFLQSGRRNSKVGSNSFTTA